MWLSLTCRNVHLWWDGFIGRHLIQEETFRHTLDCDNVVYASGPVHVVRVAGVERRVLRATSPQIADPWGFAIRSSWLNTSHPDSKRGT